MKISTTNEMIDFIDSIRNADKYMEMIFLNGGCYQFHLLLKKYADCQPLINREKNHVVTYFHGVLFDIMGIVDGYYQQLTESDIELVNSWSFHRNKMIQLGECSICEEPILA